MLSVAAGQPDANPIKLKQNGYMLLRPVNSPWTFTLNAIECCSTIFISARGLFHFESIKNVCMWRIFSSLCSFFTQQLLQWHLLLFRLLCVGKITAFGHIIDFTIEYIWRVLKWLRIIHWNAFSISSPHAEHHTHTHTHHHHIQLGPKRFFPSYKIGPQAALHTKQTNKKMLILKVGWEVTNVLSRYRLTIEDVRACDVWGRAVADGCGDVKTRFIGTRVFHLIKCSPQQHIYCNICTLIDGEARCHHRSSPVRFYVHNVQMYLRLVCMHWQFYYYIHYILRHFAYAYALTCVCVCVA